MNQITLIRALLLVLLAATTAYAQRDVTVDLKVINFDFKPIIKGTLNGKKVCYLVDTGSDLTILNTAAARTYGFKTQTLRNARVAGLNGSHTNVQVARDAEVALGALAVTGKVYVLNLEHVVSSLDRRTRCRIVGIIGSDVLRQHGVVIDYARRRVTYTAPEAVLLQADAAQ